MSEVASTLKELVAPLTESQFRKIFRERKLTFVRAETERRYSKSLGWDVVRAMIQRGEHGPPGYGIRIARESTTIPQTNWATNGKVDTAKLDEYLAKGFSIIVTHLEPYVPGLKSLCDEIKSQLLEQSYAGVIVTAGTAEGAFKIHYDPEDLIIIQIEGTKRWRIFGPAIVNPVFGEPKKPLPKDNSLIFDDVLQPGDFLFVPGGNWHHCENGLSRSVHLGVFFIPPTAWHAVRNLTMQLLSDEMFRVPLTRFENEVDLLAQEIEFKNSLIEKVRSLNFVEFTKQWPISAKKQPREES